MTVRVRFAPSPTGHLHIGGLRTALFNWLFARHYSGKFLLRIEDTDLERSQQEYTDSILESFDWCSMHSDEPIVIQSTRIAEHKKVAHEMLASGTAYRCFCTPEELLKRLGASAGEGGYTRYDNFCRDKHITDNNKPYVIRFKLPDNRESVTFNDLIHGPITFGFDTLDDFIIVRSDGTPMYNFVVVVDDAFMRITHVIRGEEHLVNTPRQILLYQACGYDLPEFAHLPLILGPDGSKLSKRDAATSVIDYKKNGFLPDALCNYLVRLGWSHGDQEIFMREELIQFFTLDHVGKKGAIFDIKKLEWLNGVYIRALDAPKLLELLLDLDFPKWSQEQLLALINVYKERVKTLVELKQELINLYTLPEKITIPDGIITPQTKNYIESLLHELEQLSEFSRADIEACIKKVCAEHAIKLPLLAQPVRLALTGTLSSPSVYDLIVVLGKQETISRLERFNKLV